MRPAVTAPPRRAFVLLDVILSITILTIVALASLRAFHQSLEAVRRSEVSARATMYAEAKLQELELDPPEDGANLSGTFADEPFYRDETRWPDAARYRYEIEVTGEPVRYRHVSLARRDQDRLVSLRRVTMRVVYLGGDRGVGSWVPVTIDTYLLGNERFSHEARQANGLY